VHFTQRGVNRTLGLAAEAAATQQALQDGEQRLRLVIETAYDTYVAMDAEGKITEWNDRAEKNLRMVAQGSHRPFAFGADHSGPVPRGVSAPASRVFSYETDANSVLSRQTELLAMDRDGREFPIEFTISAVRWGGTYLFNAFLRDITERQEYARQQEEMTRRLVETSRQAGKAEVAVGVLHNVGNVLNSVNVSAGIISDTIRASQVGALGEVVSLLRAQNGGLANFLTEDPRGRLVPELLVATGGWAPRRARHASPPNPARSSPTWATFARPWPSSRTTPPSRVWPKGSIPRRCSRTRCNSKARGWSGTASRLCASGASSRR